MESPAATDKTASKVHHAANGVKNSVIEQKMLGEKGDCATRFINLIAQSSTPGSTFVCKSANGPSTSIFDSDWYPKLIRSRRE